MSNQRNLSDLYHHIHQFAPDALVLEDDTGQLVIETGLRIGEGGALVKDAGDDS